MRTTSLGKGMAALSALGLGLAVTLMVAQPAPGQTFKVLYTFTNGADGGNPEGNLLLHDGFLYGTTVNGGNGNGTVFTVDIQTRQETVLHTFAGEPSDGTQPLTGLIRDSVGNLYGTTNGGGADNFGTVFQMNVYNTLIVLHSFTNGADGAAAEAVLARDKTGNLYGTTYGGFGATGNGTVFKLDAEHHLTTLHTFLGQPSDGAAPAAGLILSKGRLYGTTYYGGASNYGTVFEVNPNNQETTVLYSFTGGADGGYPQSNLIADANGNLYGTTTLGGISGPCPSGDGLAGCGVVFELNIASRQETVLYAFGGPDGAYPYAGLIRDSQGNLYGTTLFGSKGWGTAFELDTLGHLTTLHNFTNGADGGHPYAGLVRNASGKLFGATYEGGLVSGNPGAGTIFEIVP
jgi:uncharacterized repeat protein (TIGR03803 family)